MLTITQNSSPPSVRCKAFQTVRFFPETLTLAPGPNPTTDELTTTALSLLRASVFQSGKNCENALG
jgi:hypothetical protein